MIAAGAPTLTAGTPFTAGSTDTTCNAGTGFVLSASGSSTYASTWTISQTGTGATETVSFAGAGGATPPPLVVPQAAVMQAANW